jgi:hypothetical protein
VGDLVSGKAYLYAVTIIETTTRTYHVEATSEDAAWDRVTEYGDLDPVSESQIDWDIDSIEELMEVGPDDVGD